MCAVVADISLVVVKFGRLWFCVETIEFAVAFDENKLGLEIEVAMEFPVEKQSVETISSLTEID